MLTRLARAVGWILCRIGWHDWGIDLKRWKAVEYRGYPYECCIRCEARR